MVTVLNSGAPEGRWTAYGAVLLPLSLAGLLPPLGVALLCTLFALAVRSPLWAQGRLLITQLVVVGVILLALPAALSHPPALLALAGRFMLLSVCCGLLCWGAQMLDDGRRLGLALVIAAGLVAPQAGLLCALAGGALSRPARDDSGPVRPAPRWWTLVGVAALSAALLSLLLPHPALFVPAPPVRAPVSRAQAARPPVTPHPATRGGAEAPASPSGAVEVDLGPTLPLDLILAAAFACMLGALGLMARVRAQGAMVNRIEVLMIAGLLLTGALWLGAALALSSSPHGPAAQTETVAPDDSAAAASGKPAAAGAARHLNLRWLATGLQGTALLILAALALTLLWLNLSRPPVAAPSALTPPEPPAPPAGPPEALHRVRVAYRDALDSLEGARLPRAHPETPAQFCARVSALLPALGTPLAVLTAAYEPVRYGGAVTDQDAARAEDAAREIHQLLPGLSLPSPNPPEEPS